MSECTLEQNANLSLWIQEVFNSPGVVFNITCVCACLSQRTYDFSKASVPPLRKGQELLPQELAVL